MSTIDRRLCVAPMMDWTDRHCRYFLRLISPDAFLFTEMVTAKAIIFGDKEKLLDFNNEEHPVAVQLGGSVPAELAQAARICDDYGYDEINLNVGCPSDRVKSGMFGACMMINPELVGDCISAMQAVTPLPVTVKCRIGIDDQDSESDLNHFIKTVHKAGCSVFYIHARKAWLQGLSPKENRSIPPLDYERVYRLKQAWPNLEIIINGGINQHEEAISHLSQVDGVMLGRAAYHNPWILAQLQDDIFKDKRTASPKRRLEREDVLQQLIPYASRFLNLENSKKTDTQSDLVKLERTGTNQQNRLHSITRHIMGLYAGQTGARAFRRYMSEVASRPNASVEVLEQAYKDIIERKKDLQKSSNSY